MVCIKKSKYQNEERLEEALKGKRLPIVTLDEKWYELFPENEKTPKIKKLEKSLNDYIKKQGQYNDDIAQLNKSKSSLMKEIVMKMEVTGTEDDIKRDKRMSNIQVSINDINSKIEKMQLELEEEIPKLIEQTNLKLIIESINLCYARMTMNNEYISQITKWIDEVRDELKDKLIQKHDCETTNARIYTYMHNVMGPELMEIFDIDEPDIKAKLGGNNKIS